MPCSQPDGPPVLIMGVLNVTPDSFSDGGMLASHDQAIRRGAEMRRQGADLIDVGGESTRPGSDPVGEEEEARRVLPVLEGLRGVARLSIDTSKPGVARRAMEAGAEVVNDVTGMRNPEMRRVAADSGATVCVMHMLGEPRTMQENPVYADVVSEVRDFLGAMAAKCLEDGIPADRIWVDPGIGFGKTLEQNLLLLRSLPDIASLGFPVAVGVSRKSFIGALTGEPDPGRRLAGSLAAALAAAAAGATILRVHDVKETADAVRVFSEVRGPR